MSHFFKAKVCTKAIKPDYVDESALVVLAARVGAYDAGPRMVSSEDLRVLEYFGLLMPAAKLLVPEGIGVDFAHCTRYPYRPDDDLYEWWSGSSIVWTFRSEKWLLSLSEQKADTFSNAGPLQGQMLFPEDVDYWRAFRGVRPAILHSWNSTRRFLFERYEQNPFDMPMYVLHNANRKLDGKDVIPMYHVSDAEKFTGLISDLQLPLPLLWSILTYAEVQKRTRKEKKPKFFMPRQLREQVWDLIVSGFEWNMEHFNKTNKPLPHIQKYFYRNHYITCYVRALNEQGMSIVKACGEVAKKLIDANPQGEEPLSAETIRTKIYYQWIKNFKRIDKTVT